MAEYGTQPRMGFFTDTSVCIGCKACEVACKEWNGVPEAGGWARPARDVLRQHW
ncbi:4Fe-4S binding domain protein [Amycolatopsis sp. M39]|nr:4Fe-4S binding domain protein [Amycolatopsis sp. M39]